jgi:glycosyl hydrolase family 99/VCBS repeat protein/FG-GAP repeat protein
MRVPVAIAGLASIALVPASAASVVTQGWTIQHARTAVGRRTFSATDTRQPDRPAFTFRFTHASVSGTGRPRGSGAARTWRRFSVSGTARDAASGESIAVRFTLRPTGPTAFAVEGFRGPRPNRTQPSVPIRAAFFYPWYPENWSAGPTVPFTKYLPSLGIYDSSATAVIRSQVRALRYGRFGAAIASWWGPGQPTDRRLPLLLAAARQTPLKFAVYYEHEGYANPSVDQIRNDLHYLRDRYFPKPAYLKVQGRPVVFVYAPGDDACEVAARWHSANDVGAYINLETNGGTVHQSSELSPLRKSDTGGARVAAADVTGDGRARIVVGAGPGSEARVDVVDPQTGLLTSTFLVGATDGGVEVAATRGLIVTGVASTVSEWSTSGTLLRSVDTGLVDVRVAVGDVDGDGRTEIITAGGGAVRILDSATLATRASLAPFGGGAVYGIAAGDVDGDGRADIVAGTDAGPTGEVRVLRVDGSLVGRILDVYPGEFGGLRVGAGDFDGDGRAEVITGPARGAPDIHTYTLGSSGFSQNPATGFFAFGAGVCPCPDPSFGGGVSVAAGDLDGDGVAELITGSGEGQSPLVRTWGTFKQCAVQPSAWHYYGLSATGEFALAGGSTYTIVPGFFFAGDATPLFPRDLGRWKRNIRDMVASKARWQLVVSFNEWNEGTSVESAKAWATPSGYGAYLDALHTIDG